MSNFSLIPFASDALPTIEIVGNIDRADNILSIEYQLLGDLDSVAIASPAVAPSRKFELWESTCFEFFIGVLGDRNYWEFNLSPSGDWNVFHLDDYRQGLRNRPPAKVFIRSFYTNHFKDYLLIIKDWLNTLTNIGSVDRSRTFARGLISASKTIPPGLRTRTISLNAA